MIRPIVAGDLPRLLDLQRDASVIALARVFPQDRHPFPRDAIEARWRAEIADAATETVVAVDDAGELLGFAATSGSELLHFGTAVATWGQGTASELHDAVVDRLHAHDGQPVLFVFEGNGRARRFYEKHGWRPTGRRRPSDFEPHPVLLEYTLPCTSARSPRRT